MRQLLGVFLLVAALLGLPAAAQAQTAQPAPSAEQLRDLAALLRDPAIQNWLQNQAAAPAAEHAATPNETATTTARRSTGGFRSQVAAMRAFIVDLAEALPDVPADLAQAWLILSLDLNERGIWQILLLLVAFIGLGFLGQWLYWRVTGRFRKSIIASSLDTVTERLRAVGKRLLFGLGWVAAIAAGSVGSFLLFSWPPLLKEILLGYLSVFLLVILVRVICGFLLAPGAERFRIVPMSNAAAAYWRRSAMVLVGIFFFVQVTLELLELLGVPHHSTYAIGMILGLTLLAAALLIVWKRPSSAPDGASARPSRAVNWLLTGYLVLVWLALFTGTPALFYVGIVLMLLVLAITWGRRAVSHVLRPPGSVESSENVPSMLAVGLERGLRAALLIGGAYAIAYILEVDLGALTAQDTTMNRLVRGAIHAVIIILLADLAWHLLRAWIDGTLAGAAANSGIGPEEIRRRARLRTLLPILRNVSFVVLTAMAALMALSALGIEIGPLIAGAGVVGVAVGFGAQTLVKDVISGMFYLLDDAFRVGEYIQSGSYKGTVESFSLRSVKLRHHRGPLYTVPFGELGAVQNMSRDWVIDKLSVGVTYDTDLDKVKKVIKKVSAELMADPELAPHFIEPLKMQGVDAFGDFAIQVRMKMMTKPGEQFVIRRRANALIKKAFAANGIEFAFPTVTVTGGDADAASAAAQKAIELVRPATADAAG
ncbi:MAG: mechanosensitive ion channel [Geminicoccaceae bacterium]